MTKTTLLHRFSTAGLLCALILLGNGACTTFRGPGAFVTGGGAAAPIVQPPSISEPTIKEPALSMNGERGYTKLSESIRFNWPVDEASLSRGFLAAPIKRKRPHWGVDLANHRGTSILSSEKGTVVYTGNAFKGYGKLVVVEHNDEWATLYAHLNKILVKEGQQVSQGEKIGEMGRTGRATGVHLHFEIRHFRQPVNPLAHLPTTTGQVHIAGKFHEHLIQLSSQDTQSSPRSTQ